MPERDFARVLPAFTTDQPECEIVWRSARNRRCRVSWLVDGAVTLLVIAGAPLFFMVLVPIPVLALGCYLMLKLIEDWFPARSPDALLGLLMTAVVQFIVYALLIAMLAR